MMNKSKLKMETSLVIIKPDAVKRHLVGRIIQRIEDKSLYIFRSKMLWLAKNSAIKFYKEHEGKDFFIPLIDFMISGPTMILVVYGYNVVDVLRQIIGDTDPKKASPGTIRGDFGIGLPDNVIHASDSKVSAEREIGLFFPDEI